MIDVALQPAKIWDWIRAFGSFRNYTFCRRKLGQFYGN